MTMTEQRAAPVTVRLLPGFEVSTLESGLVEVRHPKSGYGCCVDPDQTLEAQYQILDKLATQAAWRNLKPR